MTVTEDLSSLDPSMSAEPGPILVCRGVEVTYGQVQVLFGVDMEIDRGEVVALLGTNGAGKSTMLKAISNLVDPIEGRIFFDGDEITHVGAVNAAKKGIVQVPGGKAIFPTLTVAEHFKAGSWLLSDLPPEELDSRVKEVLEMFPRLEERWDQMAGNMSGGEQQQLALGTSFIARPKLLIVDELSLGLAPTVVEQLLNVVRAINEAGTTVVLVEQSVNIALTIANRAYFMEKGEVRFSGPTEELLERGDILRSVFLEGATSADGAEADEDDDEEQAEDVVEADADGNGEVHPTEVSLADVPVEAPLGIDDDFDGPSLSVKGLSVSFGGILAVNDVSFDLEQDQILGLIGPNGAGKTTIFDLITGILTPDSGQIWVKGINVSEWGADRRSAIGLGRSFQDARIFPSLTVAENIALGLERHIEVRDHLAAALNLPAMQESEDNVAWTVDDLIDLLGLGAFRDKFVAELSTGSRRIVDLAMAIAHDPSVLLLDEPSSGIAQKETEALGPLLRKIRDEAKCALLVIEHDMPLITGISDEIIALELGAVVVRDTPEEVINHPQVVEAYLGGDVEVIHRSGASKSADGKGE